MKYITIPEAHRNNGDRHKLRGMLHSILGRPSYAAGSYLKMVKNYDHADALHRWLRWRT